MLRLSDDIPGVVDAAERSDVLVYGVMAPEGAAMQGGGMGGFRSPQFQFQIGFLRSLADATGGRVFRSNVRLPLDEVEEQVEPLVVEVVPAAT